MTATLDSSAILSVVVVLCAWASSAVAAFSCSRRSRSLFHTSLYHGLQAGGASPLTVVAGRDLSLLRRCDGQARVYRSCLVEFALKELLPGGRSCSESHSEELIGTSSLHILFVQ